MAMRTVQVTREFYEKCKELAEQAQVPEVKERLTRLAEDYRKKLDELQRVKSVPIAPK